MEGGSTRSRTRPGDEVTAVIEVGRGGLDIDDFVGKVRTSRKSQDAVGSRVRDSEVPEIGGWDGGGE